MSLTGKDSQAGAVGSVLTFYGPTPDGDQYCKYYFENLGSTALIIANVQTSALAGSANSQLTSIIDINGRQSAENYAASSNVGSGFSVSSNASETATAGVVPVEICVLGKTVQNQTVTYSLSILQ